MGFWKAEEYLKFTYPASEYILGAVLPEQHYNTWILMVRIVELVFGCCRNGWTPELVELLKQLIWRHNILTEEVEGLANCTISLHNLTHLPDDIVRHSSPDNYWCFVFERAVHRYVEKSSNNKNLEYTFAKAECRRELLKFCQSRSSEAIEQHQPGKVINFSYIYSYIYMYYVYSIQLGQVNLITYLISHKIVLGFTFGLGHFSLFIIEERLHNTTTRS